MLLPSPTTYCPSCTLHFDTLLPLFLRRSWGWFLCFCTCVLLGLALGFDGHRTFQRATRMRDVFEALAWGRGGAYCTFHGLFLCELLACFSLLGFPYYLPLFCISRDFAYGLGQGFEGIFFSFHGDWPHIRDMNTEMDWNGSIVCVVPHGIEGRLCAWRAARAHYIHLD
jgi:hypothetical protein